MVTFRSRDPVCKEVAATTGFEVLPGRNGKCSEGFLASGTWPLHHLSSCAVAFSLFCGTSAGWVCQTLMFFHVESHPT